MEKELELKLKSNLKTILASKGITQSKMKEDLKLTSNFVSNLANAKIKQLDISTLFKVCQYLDCDIKDLLTFYDFEPVVKKNRKDLLLALAA